MWWRSALAVLASLAFAPPGALAADAGRLGLLSREAADLLAAPARGTPAGLVALVVLGALAASLVGTWIGLRSQSVARIRDRHGWRELTYRFRSPSPLKVDGDLMGRMAGVLDDLEELGRRFKTVSLPAVPPGATVLAAAGGPPAPGNAAPVLFARSGDTDGVRARWIPSERASEPPRREAPAPSAPTPTAPRDAAAAARGDPARARATAYRIARRLLEAGHDREEVRRRTGLKVAEIDLLRCASGGRP
jgi:hypothetical protein